VIEARSAGAVAAAADLRLRTLSGSNVAGILMGGAIFAQFFLLTLYMQEVLHYSALHTGLAYIALTLTIILFSALAQWLVTHIGVRLVLPAASRSSAVALLLYARLPVHGSYFADLFPAFLISGLGLALAFVPMSIGALTGVRSSDAGVASGLINTTSRSARIGVAVVTTDRDDADGALTSARIRVRARLPAVALVHGFQVAFYVLAAIAATGAVLSAILLESKPAQSEVLLSGELMPELEAQA